MHQQRPGVLMEAAGNRLVDQVKRRKDRRCSSRAGISWSGRAHPGSNARRDLPASIGAPARPRPVSLVAEHIKVAVIPFRWGWVWKRRGRWRWCESRTIAKLFFSRAISSSGAASGSGPTNGIASRHASPAKVSAGSQGDGFFVVHTHAGRVSRTSKPEAAGSGLPVGGLRG